MRPQRAWGLLLILALVYASCTTRRLKEIAQEQDERTEAQLRAERHMNRATSLFDAGEGSRAQKEYLAALREDPMLFRAHLGLGDIYELEGDRLSTLAEYIAHTETASKARHYLDRMFPYVFSKFSRNPTGPKDISDQKRAKAMVVLSEAIDENRRGKHEMALRKLEDVRLELPRLGMVDYFEGAFRLLIGDRNGAAEAFEHAVRFNPYFARRLLTDREEQNIPDLLGRLERVLDQELKKYPSDTESAFLLGAINLRLGRPEKVVQISREALAWGEQRWDVLLVKAAGHMLLGQTVQMEQTFADLKASTPDLSGVFKTYEPSVFQGVLAGAVSELAKENLAAAFEEPASSYFLWRLLQEQGDQDANVFRDAFFEKMEVNFPSQEFNNLPSSEKPNQEPKGLLEFMGMVQYRVNAGMKAFIKCDVSRRSKRATPSGRITLQVDLARDGTVAQVGIQENTTSDPWLAYCVVRKLIAMHFPRSLRATESFEIPIIFGPEVEEDGS